MTTRINEEPQRRGATRWALTTLAAALSTMGVAQNATIHRVKFLPDMPAPYVLRDWQAAAKDMHTMFFDLDRKGPYLPLVWLLPNPKGEGPLQFGMPSYVGNEKQRGLSGEGICQLGALLGSSVAGFDIQGGPNWLELSTQYFNPQDGLVLNNVDGHAGNTFWYEILPSVDYVQLSLRHPEWTAGKRVSQQIADTWIKGIAELGDNFDHTSYNFLTKTPLDNKLWIEPDAAAGVAYLELAQALRSHDPKYEEAVTQTLRALENRTTNPTYEVLTPFGALTAAYRNAENGENWDIDRFLNWCFEPTAPQRPGWGMTVGKWGDYDCGGLMGSVNDGGGYAFAMNTFISAGTLAPVARYDARYSADIGKWLLNLTNASRLFYQDGLPADHQSSADWTGDPGHGLAYEGLRREWEGKSPYATGDAVRGHDAPTDIGLYGSGYVGLLAALVHPTTVPMILRIDLRATDSLPVNAYPTSLLWNPYAETKAVTIPLGSKPVRPYDAVTHRFLSDQPIHGDFTVAIPAKAAVQIVSVPATGKSTFVGRTTKVNGIPIDYDNGRAPRPVHATVTPPDYSTEVSVGRAVVGPDGRPNWDKFQSDSILLSGGDGSSMRARLRFAWDPQYLYFQVRQIAPATETVEAPSLTELRRHWWDFEDMTIDLNPGRGITSVATVPEITVGWTSTGRTDLAFCPDLASSDLVVYTSGKAELNNRIIEVRVPWSRLNAVFGTTMEGAQWPVAGWKLGCQPLLVDGTFKRQAYIGGARYARPSGLDHNSRTLVLAGS